MDTLEKKLASFLEEAGGANADKPTLGFIKQIFSDKTLWLHEPGITNEKYLYADPESAAVGRIMLDIINYEEEWWITTTIKLKVNERNYQYIYSSGVAGSGGISEGDVFLKRIEDLFEFNTKPLSQSEVVELIMLSTPDSAQEYLGYLKKGFKLVFLNIPQD